MNELKDQMQKKQRQAAMAEASVALDVYQHEVARQVAEQSAAIEQAGKQKVTYLLFVILLLAAIIITGVLFALRRVKQDRQLIHRQKDQMAANLTEKEVLLREIHHRVKNNLQIISSLLQKQARITGNQSAKQMAREGQERIKSMALVHENLYQSDQLSGVNIRNYLEDLGASISHGHSRPDTSIQLNLQVADEYLDLDLAIPIGLILNELLTNAYKYAFPDDTSGRITVAFQKIADRFQLEISDNGVGLPSDHHERSKQSLGHNLVQGLVRQLKGQLQWLQPERGTAVRILF